MTAKELGEQPASPTPVNIDPTGCIIACNHYGLSKREEFAKAAMQSLLGNPGFRDWVSRPDDLTKSALIAADALLAALAKETP